MGIDNNYKNIILAFALVDSENYENFSWVFDKFYVFMQELTPVKPDFIISDGDPALIHCFENMEIFKKTDYSICSWHQANNIKKHFSSLKRKKYKTKANFEKQSISIVY